MQGNPYAFFFIYIYLNLLTFIFKLLFLLYTFCCRKKFECIAVKHYHQQAGTYFGLSLFLIKHLGTKTSVDWHGVKISSRSIFGKSTRMG